MHVLALDFDQEKDFSFGFYIGNGSVFAGDRLAIDCGFELHVAANLKPEFSVFRHLEFPDVCVMRDCGDLGAFEFYFDFGATSCLQQGRGFGDVHVTFPD